MAELNEQGEPGSTRMRAITISREYGSGGGEVAARLARKLGWKLVDHEVVVQVASVMGISEEEAEAHDEHSESLFVRILSNLSGGLAPVSVPLPLALGPDAYDETRQKVVEAAVATGHCVIVGRGAQVLLANRPDVLHVRVVAPLEKRIAYVILREGLDYATAQKRIQAKDRDRANFLSNVHQHNPKDEHLYDLVVNTAVIDLDDMVELLCQALEKKARQINTPPEQLGPATGMSHYAGTPGNFNMGQEAKKA